MAWYNRKSKVQSALPELEKYYDAERRERSGMAWLLAIVSIAGVALVLIGVFFGGRLLYRHFKTNKTGLTTVQSPITPTTKVTSGTDTEIKSNFPPATHPTPTPTPTTDQTATVKGSTPATVAPSALTNTGPANVIPVFVVTTVLGTVLYGVKQRRNA
jgi:hypothetical protein